MLRLHILNICKSKLIHSGNTIETGNELNKRLDLVKASIKSICEWVA